MTQTIEQQKQVATTILQQLGGRRFIAMTGANNFVCGENLFICKIGRNSGKVSHLRIKLNGSDLYDMEFINIRANKVTIVAEKNNVYDDMLQTLFTEVTGMATHL